MSAPTNGVVTLPQSIMGYKRSSWSRRQIAAILDEYDIPYRGDFSQRYPHGADSKQSLLWKLHDLQTERNLSGTDRRRILRNHELGRPSVRSACSSSGNNDANDAINQQTSLLDRTAQGRACFNEQTAANATQAGGSSASQISQLFRDMHTCVVCMEELDRVQFPRRVITNACTHQLDVCLHCLRQSLTHQAETKVWNMMDCPHCGSRLAFEDMRDFATKPVFQRYDTLATYEAMSDLPDFRRCLAPGCEAGQIHCEGDAQPIMTCVGCGARTCYTHEMPWHDGQTCEDIDEERRRATERLAQAQRAENLANQAYFEHNTKRCPNTACNRPVEKNLGCQHMACSICRHQYCWDCLAPWEAIRRYGNLRHETTCPWYPENLQPHPADTQERLIALRAQIEANAPNVQGYAEDAEDAEDDGPPSDDEEDTRIYYDYS